MKLEQRFGQEFVFQVSKLDTNFAIKFEERFRKENFTERLSTNFSLHIKRAGKIFSCPWMLFHRLFSTKTVLLEENSCKRNGAHSSFCSKRGLWCKTSKSTNNSAVISHMILIFRI